MSKPVPAPRGEARTGPLSPADIAQSDVNRMATLGMRDNLESLDLLADKLYRRNPAEWRKSGQPSREAALVQLRLAVRSRVAPAALQGKRDIAALALALHADFNAARNTEIAM